MDGRAAILWSLRDQEDGLQARLATSQHIARQCFSGHSRSRRVTRARSSWRRWSALLPPVSAQCAGHLTTTSIRQPHHSSGRVGLPSGGHMLFTTALVLFAAWFLGVLGAYSGGQLVH